MAREVTLNAANRAIAQGILDQQGEVKAWAQKEHAYALRNAACAILEPVLKAAGLDEEKSKAVLTAFRPAYLTQLQADGFGGNASQFRQKLEALKMVPKAGNEDVEGYD